MQLLAQEYMDFQLLIISPKHRLELHYLIDTRLDMAMVAPMANAESFVVSMNMNCFGI